MDMWDYKKKSVIFMSLEVPEKEDNVGGRINDWNISKWQKP